MIELNATARITRSARAVRLVRDNGSAPVTEADQPLLRLILKARRWWTVLRQGEMTLTELAQREGVAGSYICRVIRVAFLSPEVVRDVSDSD